MVAFGDINLATDKVTSAFDINFKPGAGGWPSHRFFNTATGYGGNAYVQKTAQRICDELGQTQAMLDYVSEMSGAWICNARSGEHCTPAEAEYAASWRSKAPEEAAEQLATLDAVPLADLLDDRHWLERRRAVLKQLATPNEPKDEL